MRSGRVRAEIWTSGDEIWTSGDEIWTSGDESGRVGMISGLVGLISGRVIRASDCQCKSHNNPGFETLFP
jgi:hypothetical protein